MVQWKNIHRTLPLYPESNHKLELHIQQFLRRLLQQKNQMHRLQLPQIPDHD